MAGIIGDTLIEPFSTTDSERQTYHFLEAKLLVLLKISQQIGCQAWFVHDGVESIFTIITMDSGLEEETNVKILFIRVQFQQCSITAAH